MGKFFIISLTLLIIGCDNGELTAPIVSSEKIFQIDEERTEINSIYSTQTENKFLVAINENIYPDNIEIEATLSLNGDPIDLYFYDDGGLSSNSNDHIAKDGIFTSNVKNIDAGTYELKVNIKSSIDSLEYNQSDIQFFDNIAPEIDDDGKLSDNYIFESGFEPFQTEISCTDLDNGPNNIDAQILEMRFYNSDILIESFQFARENYQDKFIIPFDSSLAIGSKGEPFTLSLVAIDSYNEESNYISYSNIVLKNNSPEIVDYDIPQQYEILEGLHHFDGFVTLTDQQSLGDIESIKIRFRDSQSGSWYELLDDGNTPNNGDLVEGDGIFSIRFWINYPDPNVVAGTSVYDVLAIDKAENSTTFTDSIIFTLNKRFNR